MRIAFFADNFYPEISGISDSLLITGRELVRRGHRVAYIAPYYTHRAYEIVFRKDPGCPPGSFGEECVDGMPIVRLPSVPLPHSPTKQSRIAFPTGKSLRFLEKFKPDIIHTNSPYSCGIEAWRAAHHFHIPLVGTNHTPVAEFYPFAPNLARRLDAMYYNRCSFVSAPYAALIGNMREKGFRKEGRAVPNPVELPIFRPPSTAEKTAIKKELGLECPVVLYAGRLAAEKHVDVIIKTIARLLPEFPDLTLVATGHGMESDRLRALAEELGLEKNVRFTGFIRMEKLVLFYQAADLFCIMSTADSQSVSLMQAYATEVPAIGARARGLPDYIPDDSGFLVEPGDIDALARAMRRLLLDPLLRERMGRAGRSFVKQFSPENIAQQWEHIYRSCLEPGVEPLSPDNSSDASSSSRKSLPRMKRVSAK